MTEPKKPKKTSAPKPRAKKTKLPEYKSIPAADLEPIPGEAKLNDLATNGRLTEIPIPSEDPENTEKDDSGESGNSLTGSPQAISHPTSANFIGSLENTEQAPGKTEPTDGSSQSPLPTNSANEKNQGDRFQQDSDDSGTLEAPGTTDGTDSTQLATTASEENMGDVANPEAATGLVDECSVESTLPPARVRDGETKGQCRERLRQEARTSGMTRRDSISYAGRMVEQVWIPPPPPEPVIIEELPAEPEPIPEPPAEPEEVSLVEVAPVVPADNGVSGLGDLPESWGQLPANAQLQVEIAWVSANRLRVRSGNGVDLSRALSPAPSYSALSWLETSILFPSKFADISVKATSQQDDEREHIKREKLAIEEIRSILAEMLEE